MIALVFNGSKNLLTRFNNLLITKAIWNGQILKLNNAIIFDDFNRSNQTGWLGKAVTGQTWNGYGMSIEGNKAYNYEINKIGFNSIESGRLNVTATVYMSATGIAGNTAGIAVRSNGGSSNRMFFELRDAGRLQLRKTINDTHTILASKYNIPIIEGKLYKMQVICKGNNFKCFFEDELIFDITDDNALKNFTQVGLLCYSSQKAYFDNFVVEDIL